MSDVLHKFVSVIRRQGFLFGLRTTRCAALNVVYMPSGL